MWHGDRMAVNFDLVRELQAIREGGTAGAPFSEREPEPVQIPWSRATGTAVGGSGPSLNLGGGPLKAQVRNAAKQYGWTGGEWRALNELINRESSWNPSAQNPTSTAWGLFQFLDMHWGPGKYLPRGRSSSVAEQIAGGLRYIRDRYGRPSAAISHHNRMNWY